MKRLSIILLFLAVPLFGAMERWDIGNLETPTQKLYLRYSLRDLYTKYYEMSASSFSYANDAGKLGGQLPAYYATASSLSSYLTNSSATVSYLHADTPIEDSICRASTGYLLLNSSATATYLNQTTAASTYLSISSGTTLETNIREVAVSTGPLYSLARPHVGIVLSSASIIELISLSTGTQLTAWREYPHTVSSCTAHITGGNNVVMQIWQQAFNTPDAMGTLLFTTNFTVSSGTANNGATFNDATLPGAAASPYALFGKILSASGDVKQISIDIKLDLTQ